MESRAPPTTAQWVNVGMWITLIPTVIAAVGKVYTKWFTARRIEGDDISVFVALFLAIGHSITITKMVYAGLGEDIASISADNVDTFLKSYYASQIFLILSTFAAKFIGLFFYTFLCGTEIARNIVRSVMGIVAAWAFIAIFVVGFQCHLPAVWDVAPDRCVDLKAFFVLHTIVDVSTQLAVGFLPTYLLFSLNVSQRSKKWLTMAAFTPNLLTIPLAILRVTYWSGTWQSDNLTKDLTFVALISGLHAFVAVLAGAVPFAKPIIDSIVSEAHLIEETKHIPAGYYYGSSSNGRSQERSQNQSQNQSQLHSRDRSQIQNRRQSRANPALRRTVLSWPASLVKWPRMSMSLAPQSPTSEDMPEEGVDLGNFTTVSTKKAESVITVGEQAGPDHSRDGSQERIIIRQTKTATVTTVSKET